MIQDRPSATLDWRVLLIGGSSAIGKTTVARDLGRRLGVSVIPADDIRLAVQQLIPLERSPTLHYF